MTRIPLDPIGYKVDGSTIHTRYATHGDGQRTRTAKGVETLLDGKKGKPCVECYGKAPRYAEGPRPPQKRRTAASAIGKNGDAPIRTWARPAVMVDDHNDEERP